MKLLPVTKLGFKNFWRNGWLTISTTLVMVLTLFFLSAIVILNLLLNSALTSVKEKIDINVYFKENTSEKEVASIQKEVEALREVKSAQVVSKEEAIKIFTEKHKNNPLISSLLAELEENPLQISLIVKARNPEDYSIINDFLKKDRYKKLIEEVSYDDNRTVIQKVNNISRSMRQGGIAVGLIFAIIAIIFMFNTVRMTIYNQQEEIKTMRLVGATNSFIRFPYLIEGALYGIFATLLNTGLLYFAIWQFSSSINKFFGSSLASSVDIFSYFLANILWVILAQAVFAVFLGIFSSLIATLKYLKD